MLHAHRFARYVASERFAPRVMPDHLASPTYIVLLDGTAATSAALAGGATVPLPAGAGTAAAAPLPSVEEVLHSLLSHVLLVKPPTQPPNQVCHVLWVPLAAMVLGSCSAWPAARTRRTRLACTNREFRPVFVRLYRGFLHTASCLEVPALLSGPDTSLFLPPAQVPAGTTVAALLSGAGPKLAAHSGLRVLVNGEVASDPQQLLVHGDQVCCK